MQSPTVTVWPAVQESKELGVFEGEGVDTCQHCALPLGPLSDWEKPYPLGPLGNGPRCLAILP